MWGLRRISDPPRLEFTLGSSELQPHIAAMRPLSQFISTGCLAVTLSLTSNEFLQAESQVEISRKAPAFLTHAGENRNEIEQALKLAPNEQRAGLIYLLTHMPKKDLLSLKHDFLLDNLKWAYHARNTYPWAKLVPEDIFFNDVLPYASLDERRDNWRADFHQRFGTLVKDAKTQQEALDIINNAINKEVKVEYNTKRNKPNQSPYESMEIGMASCTGLSILLTDAFRAVGIPSRVAGIPSWTTKRGNHNWVEVWTSSDQQWHFTEYYPNKKGLDHSWFVADAVHANPKSLYHSIYASSWKSTEQHFPMVWDFKSTVVPAVNVTERYLKLRKAENIEHCELRIDFTNAAGERAAIPVKILQGDVVIEEGATPKAVDDMNRFFSVPVTPGLIYQVAWLSPESTQWKMAPIQSKKEDKHLRIKLDNLK